MLYPDLFNQSSRLFPSVGMMIFVPPALWTQLLLGLEKSLRYLDSNSYLPTGHFHSRCFQLIKLQMEIFVSSPCSPSLSKWWLFSHSVPQTRNWTAVHIQGPRFIPPPCNCLLHVVYPSPPHWPCYGSGSWCLISYVPDVSLLSADIFQA